MIFLGLLFALITGLLWGSVGVIFSWVAKNKYDYLSLMTTSILISAVFAWITIPQYSVFFSDTDVPRLTELSIIFVLSGVFAAFGMVCMNKGMRMGHHASTWTIGQSALALPFLTGVFIWNDIARIWNVIGVAAILSGIVLLGISKQEKEEEITKQSGVPWLIIALGALFLLGIQQTLTTIPSRWEGWSDIARLRVPLGRTGGLIGFFSVAILLKRYPDKKIIKFGLLLSLVGLPSQVLFFKSLDYFAQVSRAAIAYPIAVGTCIVSFALYSVFVIREPLNKVRTAGIIFGTIGIVLTALK